MWLLPSRCRPANLARFFDAYRKTGGSTPGLVLLGPSDDARSHAPNENPYPALPLGWSYVICAGDRQGEKIAEVWDQIKDCAWFGLIGDDCVPETAGWDKALVGGLSPSVHIVSCDDGWQAPTRIGNCWVMSGEIVRALGYIFPPPLQHLYVDDLWETIGREAKVWRVNMLVRVAHRHVLKGEAEADETHRGVYGDDATEHTGGLWPEDGATWERWQREDKAGAIAAARALRPAEDANAEAAEKQRLEQRLARARTRRVLIATPSAHPKIEFAKSLFATAFVLQQYCVECDFIYTAGSSNLPKARNGLAAHFLASRYTDLLFIDDDMGWAPGAVMRLLASDHPVVAAAGLKKTDTAKTWCLKLLPGTEGGMLTDDMGAIEVFTVGTGMMRIAREALEAIIAARPDLKLENVDADMPEDVKNLAYRFFAFGPNDEGEDYTFCQLYRSVGGEIWVDQDITLSHTGDKSWTGKFADSMTVLQDVEIAA